MHLASRPRVIVGVIARDAIDANDARAADDLARRVRRPRGVQLAAQRTGRRVDPCVVAMTVGDDVIAHSTHEPLEVDCDDRLGLRQTPHDVTLAHPEIRPRDPAGAHALGVAGPRLVPGAEHLEHAAQRPGEHEDAADDARDVVPLRDAAILGKAPQPLPLTRCQLCDAERNSGGGDENGGRWQDEIEPRPQGEAVVEPLEIQPVRYDADPGRHPRAPRGDPECRAAVARHIHGRGAGVRKAHAIRREETRVLARHHVAVAARQQVNPSDGRVATGEPARRGDRGGGVERRENGAGMCVDQRGRSQVERVPLQERDEPHLLQRVKVADGAFEPAIG